MSRDQSPALPSQYVLVFRVRRCAGLPGDDGYPLMWTAPIQVDALAPTDPDVSSDLVPRSGVSKSIRDTAVALWDTSRSASTPTNSTALTTLAKRIAQDYFDWATADEPGDIVLRGIVAPQPNGLIDCVEFAYTREYCYTRIQSPPMNGWPDELCHYDPATAACTDANNSGRSVDGTPGVDVVSGPLSCTGGGAKAHISSVDSNGAITGITVDSGGTYTSTPVVYVSDNGASSGASLTATGATGGSITGVTIGNGGSGYSVNDIVSFYGGGGQLQYTVKRVFIEDGRLAARFQAYRTVGQ